VVVVGQGVDWEAMGTRLADAARDLAAQDGVQDTLDRITEWAVDLVDGCEAAGILVVRDEQVVTVAGTDNVVRASDRLQDELREGPCFDATVQKQRVFRLADLTEPDEAWPRYTARARELGIGSIMGVLLYTTDKDNLGALALYSSRPGAFTEESERVALAFASHAAVALAGAVHDQNLHAALDSARTIGEAIGIIRSRRMMTNDDALALLKETSQNTNTKLRELAERITHTGEIPQRH
jgi:ANTAR domain./GAF domain.